MSSVRSESKALCSSWKLVPPFAVGMTISPSSQLGGSFNRASERARCGRRCVQSCPLRVKSRTLPRSTRASIR